MPRSSLDVYDRWSMDKIYLPTVAVLVLHTDARPRGGAMTEGILRV